MVAIIVHAAFILLYIVEDLQTLSHKMSYMFAIITCHIFKKPV